MTCLFRTVYPLDKRRFLLFIAAIFWGSALCAFAQETTGEPETVLVPETQDKTMLEIDSILGEELKQVSLEWKNSLFTEENVNLIKANVRKTLPEDAGGMSDGSRKALIRKSVRDNLYNSMKSIVIKGAESLLLELIDKLPPDWRDAALTGDTTGKILQQATSGLDMTLLNLPKKEREPALQLKMKQEIINFQQAVVLLDVEKVFSAEFNKWPETMRSKVDAAQTRAALKLLVDTVLKMSTPETARKEMGLIIKKEVSSSLYRLVEMLVDAEMMEVIARESGTMGPGLTNALIVDEKAFKELIAEIRKTLFQNMDAASAQKDPLLFYKTAAEKVLDIVRKIFMREKEKFAGICMKESVPEDTALNHEKYWLMFPLPDKSTKEQETFPYIDERYYNCKAVSENNLDYCMKFKFPGREEHDVACKVYSFLFLKILPALVNTKEYPGELVNALYALDATVAEKKDVLEPLLRAFTEKNASRCEQLKAKDENWYPVCRSAINRDLKACTGTAFPESCKQNSLAFEAVLYNDDSKIKGIAFDDIVSSFPLLSKVYFDKNACNSFYKDEIMKRYCNNLYMYKPTKEVKKDEKEKEQKQKQK